ncbi:helix-turn-helix transcriptional regulator [Microtetraspora malaysiensis]|uniref:Helix-turn-helix transcriptional regulator n=1 Tax=Microtetraspora malaysiensis TaxID=161358 RepID=A0ABW6SMK5_9ACTN
MSNDLHPIVALLDRSMRRRQALAGSVAKAIGVTSWTISNWRNGHSIPGFADAVAWAEQEGKALAVVDKDGNVLAVGLEIPDKFPDLRERADMSQAELGDRLNLGRSTIGQRERGLHEPRLGLVADHVAALGFELVALDVKAETR